MSAHLLDVIQRTPVESLRAYFSSVSPEAFENVDWTAPRPTLVDALIEMVLTLDETAQERVFSDVDRIAQFLVDEHGRRALRGVLPNSGDLLERFDALEDVTACAFFVLMRNKDQFDHALSAHYAQRFLNRRDWTGLDFEPGINPTVRADPSIDDFQTRLSDIFATEGPIPRVVVNRFTFHASDPAGIGNRTCEQFTVYFEAPPKSELVFAEQGKVEARTARPVHEAAFLFDAKERTLDVVAKGAVKAQRQQMADAFVETILAPGATLAARPRRNLVLDLLKHRPNFDVRPEDRVRSVEVTRLALRAPDFGSMATFEFRGRDMKKRAEADLYDRAERAFGRNGIPARTGWSVLSAKLRIVFEPEKPKTRPKSVTFELKWPDRTNLRDQIELHRQIADTLLARWGLYQGDQ